MDAVALGQSFPFFICKLQTKQTCSQLCSLALAGLHFISHLRAWNLIFHSILADSQQRQLRESSLALIPQHNNTVDASTKYNKCIHGAGFNATHLRL